MTDTNEKVAALVQRLLKVAQEDWDEQPSGEGLLCGLNAVGDFLHGDEVYKTLSAALRGIESEGQVPASSEVTEPTTPASSGAAVREAAAKVCESQLIVESTDYGATTREVRDHNRALRTIAAAIRALPLPPLAAEWVQEAYEQAARWAEKKSQQLFDSADPEYQYKVGYANARADAAMEIRSQAHRAMLAALPAAPRGEDE